MCLQCLSKVHGNRGRESMDVTAELEGKRMHTSKTISSFQRLKEPARSLNMSFSLLCKISLVGTCLCACCLSVGNLNNGTWTTSSRVSKQSFRLIMVLFHKGSKFTLGGWNSDSVKGPDVTVPDHALL